MMQWEGHSIRKGSVLAADNRGKLGPGHKARGG